ncbi:MAG: hypothetical protein R3B96_23950 [Pirellulaceae bacterium]
MRRSRRRTDGRQDRGTHVTNRIEDGGGRVGVKRRLVVMLTWYCSLFLDRPLNLEAARTAWEGDVTGARTLVRYTDLLPREQPGLRWSKANWANMRAWRSVSLAPRGYPGEHRTSTSPLSTCGF